MSTLPSYAECRARSLQACSLSCVVSTEPESPLQGVLAEVGERSERSGYERFSLLFRANGQPRQGRYAVTFADGASWELFLVPVAQAQGQIVYEACFNREAVG